MLVVLVEINSKSVLKINIKSKLEHVVQAKLARARTDQNIRKHKTADFLKFIYDENALENG